jgi:hypothetical protein
MPVSIGKARRKYVLLFSQSLLNSLPRMLSFAKLKCSSKTFQFRMLGCSFSGDLILTPLSSS